MKTYTVLNVKCQGCASTLKKNLFDEFGDVDVNLDTMPRIITIYNDEINEENLRKKLISIGYPLEDEDLNIIDNLTTKGKSFVSCAIGKINS